MRALSSVLLDILFPLLCLACRKKGEWICSDCQKRIPLYIEHRCPVCKKTITPAGETCRDCYGHSSLDGIFSATFYEIPIISRAIHTYKYRFVPEVSKPLATVLQDALLQKDLPLPEALVPVPLHPRRLRFRGFNQAELLARELSQLIAPELSLPVIADALKRIRYTKPQMKTTSRTGRLANLKDAFSVDKTKQALLKNKRVWLIDDVATTNTTLSECAKVLKENGAKSVFGIVVAR